MEVGDELEAVAVIADDDRDEHALHLDRAGERLDVRGIERANVVADANVDERDVAWCLAGCRRHQALPSGCGPPRWRADPQPPARPPERATLRWRVGRCARSRWRPPTAPPLSARSVFTECGRQLGATRTTACR